jgi:fatty-acyl-CoA synthase
VTVDPSGRAMQTPLGETSQLAARFLQLAREHGADRAVTFRLNPPLPGDGSLGGAGLPKTAIDFATFWRRVERVTGHLQSRWRVQPGERVAWLGFNHELQLVMLVACARLGAIFMPLNFRLAAAELQQVIDDAQPRLLVHDAHHESLAQALRGRVMDHTHPDHLVATKSTRGLPLPIVDGDMPLLLVYTSGTTGLPKGAVHTQAAVMANARASHWAHDFVPGDKVLSTLPLFHVGGLCIQTLPALLAGVEVMLHARFEASAWLDEVSISQPTLSLLVPSTMRALFDHPRWPAASLAGLRGIMTGSSTVPAAYLDALHARGVPVGQVYGTTETGPVSIVLRLPEAVARVGASGWPQPEAHIKLVDEQGLEVGTGETGEVCIRASNLMSGYWSGPRSEGHPATAERGLGLQAGWFHSGDLGQRAGDGCITIVGRSKDMIISGGENIYPAEIENHLVTLAGVAECAVVGLPDARWGEMPVAVLVRSNDAAGREVTQEGVLAHLQSRIARFKWPRRVVFKDSLPKNALGKVQKAVLQRVLAGADG